MQQEVRGFSVEETVIRQTVSSSNNDKCEINDKVNKNHMLHNVHYLQHRVNNLNIENKKTSFAPFKVKRRIFLG